MAILRQLYLPQANPVSLRKRQSNMADDQFYQQDPQQSNEQYQNQPLTGDYLAASLSKLANRQAPPQLDPISRVTQPNMNLVAPNNFQGYYDNLGFIKQLGDEQLATAQARASYKRMQQLQALQAQQPGAFRGAGSPSSSKGGNAYGNPIPSNPQANFRFAQQVAPQFGWNAQELQAWYTLGMKESGWRNTAQNPTSTAYGIGQFLNSTWAGVGIAKTSDPYTQVLAMAKYIKNRYGSPSAALAFHLRNNWY